MLFFLRRRRSITARSAFFNLPESPTFSRHEKQTMYFSSIHWTWTGDEHSAHVIISFICRTFRLHVGQAPFVLAEGLDWVSDTNIPYQYKHLKSTFLATGQCRGVRGNGTVLWPHLQLCFCRESPGSAAGGPRGNRGNCKKRDGALAGGYLSPGALFAASGELEAGGS